MAQPPEQKDFSVLVPLLDMTNHQPLAQVEWRMTADGVGLVVHKALVPGEEIPNNYGPRNNERCELKSYSYRPESACILIFVVMANYGFCIPGNVCDYRELALNPPPGTPLRVAKERRHELFPQVPMKDKYYIYNIFYPLPADIHTLETSMFSRDLLDAAGVLSLSPPRGIDDLVIEEDRIYIRTERYGNSRYLLSALGHITKALVHSVRTLKSSPYFNAKPQNARQNSAKQYRHAQVYLAECAIAVAEWTLSRAKNQEGTMPEVSNRLDSVLRDVSDEWLDGRHRERIQLLIEERPSALRYCGELFKDEQVSQALSGNARLPFKNFIIPAVENMSVNEPNRRMLQSMAMYTLFICFCAAAYRNIDEHEKLPNDHPRSVLPARLHRWVTFLMTHYPVPSSDEHWVLEDNTLEDSLRNLEEELMDKERAPGNARIKHLDPLARRWRVQDRKNWYRGNWLRWAWLTAEKETVELLNDPLQPHYKEEKVLGSELFSEDLYLYIPQEVEVQES